MRTYKLYEITCDQCGKTNVGGDFPKEWQRKEVRLKTLEAHSELDFCSDKCLDDYQIELDDKRRKAVIAISKWLQDSDLDSDDNGYFLMVFRRIEDIVDGVYGSD